MKKLLLLTAGMMLSAGMAAASITAEQLVAAYQAQGYTTIDVTTGVSQIKVEAVLNQTQVEVIYDMATGAILNQEQSVAGANDANQGVEIATANADFLAGSGVEKSGKKGALALASGTDTEDDSADDNGSDSGSDMGSDDNGASGSDSGDDSSESESDSESGDN